MRNDILDFRKADKDPEPRCLLGKDWQQIKLDLLDAVISFNEE